MSIPIDTTPPGVFDFLRLPPELRNRIYQLHLSKEGDIDHQRLFDEGPHIRFNPPAVEYPLKPVLDVNILRVCRQIYNEAVTFAYADRMWILGCALTWGSRRCAIDCTYRCCREDTTSHTGYRFQFVYVSPHPHADRDG
jgi:hypothetical protein